MITLVRLFDKTKPHSLFAALEDAAEHFGSKYPRDMVELAYNSYRKI